ncbi:YjbQ family protein [bacterium]|nr:YjbQ family protein [bacterium]
MTIITDRFNINTKGFTDIIDITSQITDLTKKHDIKNANAHIYVIGSTASITTLEYEPGLIKDLPEALEKIAPVNKEYHHDQTWQDGNGYAHIRSAMIGTSENIPIVDGALFLGTWQQIVLVDFDNKPRTRTILVQFLF